MTVMTTHGGTARRGFGLDDLLIILVLLVSSRAAFENFADQFLLSVFTFTAIVWMWRGGRLNMTALLYALVTLLWIAYHVVISDYTNFRTIAGHYLRFGTAFFVICSVRDPIERLTLWVIRFSVFGLALFALGVVVPGLVQLLFELTPPAFRFIGGTVAGEQLTGAWARANWLIYTFSPDRMTQNHGFMWEPAAYAMAATMALWARILGGQSHFDSPNVILIVAIASTVSTTGMVALFVTLAWMMIRRRALGVLLLVIAMPFAIGYFIQSDYLLDKIIAEWQTGYSSQMQWSLSRFASFQIDMSEFETAPLAGIGIVTDLRPLAGARLSSNNGLSDYLTRYGILMSGSFAALFFWNVKRYFRADSLGTGVFFTVILLFSWSEKFFELPIFYIWVFASTLTPGRSSS